MLVLLVHSMERYPFYRRLLCFDSLSLFSLFFLFLCLSFSFSHLCLFLDVLVLLLLLLSTMPFSSFLLLLLFLQELARQKRHLEKQVRVLTEAKEEESSTKRALQHQLEEQTRLIDQFFHHTAPSRQAELSGVAEQEEGAVHQHLEEERRRRRTAGCLPLPLSPASVLQSDQKHCCPPRCEGAVFILNQDESRRSLFEKKGCSLHPTTAHYPSEYKRVAVVYG